MQQFTVPQFIDVEDKVIGPITVRQFVILLFSAALIAICYKLLYFNTFIVVAIFIMFITGVIAFAKVNGVNFHVFFVNFLITLFKANVRVWNNSFGKEFLRIEGERVVSSDSEKIVSKNNYSSSRLTELALIVDTQGVFRGENPADISTPDFTKEVHSR
jgi:hypothetical protein